MNLVLNYWINRKQGSGRAGYWLGYGCSLKIIIIKKKPKINSDNKLLCLTRPPRDPPFSTLPNRTKFSHLQQQFFSSPASCNNFSHSKTKPPSSNFRGQFQWLICFWGAFWPVSFLGFIFNLVSTWEQPSWERVLSVVFWVFEFK